MTDNIFDAERNRRIQHLQQQSVSNVIMINPSLRSVLSRYEDAEVSRLKLLELQRLRNKKITAGEKALLKGIIKGRRATGRGGRGKKQKETKPAEPQKSQTQIEVEAEEKRVKIKQEAKKLLQQDRFLELEDFRQQRRFITDMATIGQRENQRLTDFATGQNRIIADAQIAQFNQQQENFRANIRGIDRILDRQLQQDSLNLQNRQTDNQFQTNRAQIALEERRLQAQLTDIRERVGRDDAFRHAQLQEIQRLALEQLAAQRLDNTERAETERMKIQNQRAVDAERAITDREREQTLQATLDLLNRTQEAEELPIGRGLSEEVGGLPTGRGLVEDVSLSETSGSGNIEALLQERRFERRGLDDPLVEGEPTPGALRENPKPKVKPGGATEAEILSELGSISSNTSSRPSAQQNFLTLEQASSAGSSSSSDQNIFQVGSREERTERIRKAAKTPAERQRRAAEAGVLQEQQAADTSLRETNPQPEPERAEV